MNIDKIFIINLKHRSDRKEKIMKELKRMDITNYEFFEGIIPKKNLLNEWNKDFINPIPNWLINTNINIENYRLSSLGCLLSHYKIIEISKNRGYKNVMILEDDTKFEINKNIFNNIFNDLKPQLDLIKDSYGILYLTGNHGNYNTKKQISLNLIQTINTLTTSSYIINERAMEIVLKKIKKYNREIDVFFIEYIQSKIPCFYLYPHLTSQIESYSDILQKNVNYNLTH